MARLVARVDRILRVRCDFRNCSRAYDYTGPKSSSFAITEAQAFGWVQRGTFFVCPTHATAGVIER
jgi:hypothetical protein